MDFKLVFMRKLICLLIIFLFYGMLFSQTKTLEFDYVLWEQFSTSGYTLTVPAGKVFKVTAVFVDYPSSGVDNNDYVFITHGTSATTVQAADAELNSGPQIIWLPEGTYIFDCNDNSQRAAFSGIMFKVITNN